MLYTNMKFRLVFLLVLYSLCDDTESARILASIFSPSFSHNVVYRPLWKELAKRGHHITLLTTNPMKDPELENIREIDLSGSYSVMEKYNASDLLSRGRNEGRSRLNLIVDYLNALDHTADWQLEQPDVKNLIQNKSEHFDLLIVEVMNPIQMAFAERFKVPFIGITPLDAPYRIHAAIGNYMHPTVYPDYFYPFAPPLNFLQRLASTLLNWANWYLQYYTRYPAEDLIARKHFGDDVRALSEIEKDMSLLFINVNPIFHLIRPLGLNTIIVGGGTHVESSKLLPKDLLEYVESAENGLIYFSLGTNVKSSLITDAMKEVILSTFADLPYKVLWKFEDDSIQGLPKNVKTVKWVPQQDLLGHPNIKLFITQCGLQSMEEAIFNNVPMVGMPFMGDQLSNARILENKRLGLTVDKLTLTKKEFTEAILEVIGNSTYRENVREIYKLSKDVEITGLERAVWWTEYCIRTKGAKHLRSPVVDLPTYQFYLLDVLAFITAVLVLIICIIWFGSKLSFGILCKLCGKSNKQKKD